LDKDTIDYIFKYCSRFMTDEEVNAWKHYSTTFKFEGHAWREK